MNQDSVKPISDECEPINEKDRLTACDGFIPERFFDRGMGTINAQKLARAYESALQAAIERAERADRLEYLVKIMLEEDPMECVADGGVTMLDVWRKDASAIMEPAQ